MASQITVLQEISKHELLTEPHLSVALRETVVRDDGPEQGQNLLQILFFYVFGLCRREGYGMQR